VHIPNHFAEKRPRSGEMLRIALPESINLETQAAARCGKSVACREAGRQFFPPVQPGGPFNIISSSAFYTQIELPRTG
jgi:hypothetical protein